MLAMVVGCKPPTPLSVIVTFQRGHFGHFLNKSRDAPRAVNCQRSLLRCRPWTSWSGRGGRIETGVVFICDGELRSRIRIRVGRGVGMDWVPILDQYLMREMVPVLVLAVAVCSSLGMSLGALAGLIREVAVSGLPLRVAGAAAVLQLPYFAAVSMPTACLAASLFGLGRLQSDMESVALFAAGVPLWRMLLTPLCICLVGAALKLACHNYLVPYGSSQARKMVETALTTHMQGLRQTEDLIYQEFGTTEEEMGEDGRRIPSRRSYGLQRIWYASKMEGARLAGLLLLEVLPSGYVHRVVVGDAAEWQMNESTWNFSNSTVLDVSPAGNTRRILQMDGLRVPSTPLTSGRAFRKRTLHELSRSEIVSEMNRLQSSNVADRVINGKMVNKLDCFLCQRDAAAFSCVVYGLIGALATLAPSGRGSRSVSRATPFAWAMVATLVFSATVAVGMALGSTGALNPWWSAWLPPLLGVSLILLLVIFGPSELQHLLQRKLGSHAGSHARKLQ